MAEEKAEVMFGFAAGKNIQAAARFKTPEFWEDNSNPTWDWVTYNYRFKPRNIKALASEYVRGVSAWELGSLSQGGPQIQGSLHTAYLAGAKAQRELDE